MTIKNQTDMVIRMLGSELACFVPTRRLPELQRAVSALRAAQHDVRIEPTSCRLQGCHMDGYNLFIAPEHETALIEALP